MNRKLIKYFKDEGLWFCYNQKLGMVGYGDSKQEAYKSFMLCWNYIRYEHKNKN